MSHEIYIFGSTTRGDVSPSSDVDVLVIPEDNSNSEFPTAWSVYSKETLRSYFDSGRLFAWHLHLEAIRIFPRSGMSFLSELGPPSSYKTAATDISDLQLLLEQSLSELRRNTHSPVYELGLVYTAIRDIAMAASWAMLGNPSFSRYAPYQLPEKCPLPLDVYESAMRARHASTRGTPEPTNALDAALTIQRSTVLDWTASIRRKTCQTPF